jgi:hypothetical protein
VKLCEGTWEEMKAGCNAFLPSLVSNPGWFASIFPTDPRSAFAASSVSRKLIAPYGPVPPHSISSKRCHRQRSNDPEH